MTRPLFALALLAVGFANAPAQVPVAGTTRVEWTVGGVKREALVAAPAAAKASPSPLVFAFHGHGGSMTNVARAHAFHKHWPEAVCVYPQGLPTPSKLVDPDGKKAGWQHTAGEQAGRDLAFFDAMLKTIKADYKIDEKRVFVTGHSNGGRFTHLLMAERGDGFAAFAPSASIAAGLVKGYKAKPYLHVAGETDQLVPFAAQQRTIAAVKALNGCAAEGKDWAKAGVVTGVRYESKGGTPVVTLTYPGDHAFPAADAVPLVVRFFQENPGK
ncbi:alpha/beta hydrolase family esterase [Urbifossiella limnaea]|uniref:Alpha/beta hydrolase family protein n=1 Tax=Urbifossiella limnaea TaxID=2528023 RepID=A0A517XMV8_9BACT|nr:prolyl oligopeptidase family serine peptidase [Urbifossiella limnaea]QDU18849.1 Alpha/beta hydrolase family protein [Urbifossiella limnaea]